MPIIDMHAILILWKPSATLTIFIPHIYAKGYIVFFFPFVRSFLSLFIHYAYHQFVDVAIKYVVKVSQVVNILATSYQISSYFYHCYL